MLVLHANDHLEHAPKTEYYDGEPAPYAEQPDRIVKIADTCRRLGLVMREVTEPAVIGDITRLHGGHYAAFVRDKCQTIPGGEQMMPSVFISDTYTPLTAGTYKAALKSAGLALEAAEVLIRKEDGEQSVYALCRPPGHHAEFDAMGGYCYFNNAALAADMLAVNSRNKKVAVLDIDYHHGNGTQRMFYDRGDVMYVSLHADPEYAFPYITGFANENGVREGQGFNRNFPLPASTTPESYVRTLDRAMEEINTYGPDYLVLSLGFDTYKGDPVGNLGLDEKTYKAIGGRIATELTYPTVIIQEGGYNVDKLGELAEQFITGYQAAKSK